MRIPEFIRLRLRAWAHKKTQTPPDFVIRPNGQDQTLRWFVIPKNRFFNIYLHKFVLSDEDRALHCHPWPNCSILIDGEYIEWTLAATRPYANNPKVFRETHRGYRRKEGFCYFRKAAAAHRVELLPVLNMYQMTTGRYYPVTTIFITGPKIREWGFWCPKGWRHWRDFCDARDTGVIGRGCDD